MGLFSTIVGILLSLYTTTIKRLLAYSAITHVGYIIVSISLLNLNTLDVFLIYVITYVLSSINLFAILSVFRKNNSFYKIKNIVELCVLSRSNPYLAFIVALAFLSSSGIPPLAGFFGKFFVFESLSSHDAFFIAGLFILLSVVSVVYYIRLLRFIFFDNVDIDKSIYSIEMSFVTSIVLSSITALNFLFLFYQNVLLM